MPTQKTHAQHVTARHHQRTVHKPHKDDQDGYIRFRWKCETCGTVTTTAPIERLERDIEKHKRKHRRAAKR